MPEFLPGRELARAFYEEVVAGLVGDIPHSAGFLGYGSDVLGYDTERSTDHGWGPRLQIFTDTRASISSRTFRRRFAAGRSATAGTRTRCGIGWT